MKNTYVLVSKAGRQVFSVQGTSGERADGADAFLAVDVEP
jgi:hypothetical protein